MKGIFYTTRAVSGREGKNIIRHMKAIESQSDDITFMTTGSTDAGKRYIETHGSMKIDRTETAFTEWYQDEAINLGDWQEVYEKLDVSRLEQYDNLYLIGGLDLHRSNLTRYGSRVGVFPKDKGQLKFQSCGVHLCNILALLKAHNEFGIPLHEISYDPNEMAMNLFHEDYRPKNEYHCYHGYDIPKYGIKRLDSLQYYLLNKSGFPDDFSEKTIDFTFGYTVLQKSGREKFVDDVNRIATSYKTYQVHCKNEYTGEDTHIDNDAYLDKIGRSRFTLMLPSYDTHCFSNYRFVESLYRDCLPLIHPACNISDVNDSFGVDLSVLKFAHMEEEMRLELLNHLKKIFLATDKLFR